MKATPYSPEAIEDRKQPRSLARPL
jgi:hypothetical protein